MSKFPSESRVVFLVCDDFRPEVGGKSSILGVYGETVLVESPPKDVREGDWVLPALAFYFAFTDGEGKFTASVNLVAPSGKELLPNKMEQVVEKNSAGWMNFAFKVTPFPIELGSYKLTVRLDNKEYSRTFMVTETPSAA